MKRAVPQYMLEERRGMAKVGRLFTHLSPVGEKLVFAFSTEAAVEAFRQVERLGREWRGTDLGAARLEEWHQVHARDATDLVAVDARSTRDAAFWVVPLVAWVEGLNRASRGAGPTFVEVQPYPNRRRPRLKQLHHPMQGRCEAGQCACGRALQFDFRPDLESDDPAAYLRVIAIDKQTRQEVEQCPGCGQPIASRDDFQAEADRATAALFDELPAER